MTEKLPELKTNILDLMFLDSVDGRFKKWSRTESDQGKLLVQVVLAHLSVVAYMLERGECSSLLCNSCKLHNHQGL